jgi:xanthine dehydrogenase small subunit
VRDYLLLHINGIPHRIGEEDAFQSLSRFLRYDLRSTGTKIVCEEGDCGACTVLVGRRENGGLKYRPINSCIQFLFQLDCTHVVTVEGLAGRSDELTPVQDAMVRCHGAQCGYCTPGFITALAGMFEHTEHPTAADVRCALTGNLCRCTGYEPIIRAALDVKSQPKIEELFPSEPILRAIGDVSAEPVRIGNFAKPASLESAIEFKAEHPNTVIVQGATDFGVWRNKRGFNAEALLSLDAIETLGDIRIDDRTLVVGGRVTLAQFESSVRDLIPELAPIMDRFGSPQIKNAGTLAGNIANGSPIADSIPFLFVTHATLELTGKAGARVLSIRDFYLGYKKFDLRADEIITSIRIPLPAESETLRLYKISKRTHLDISSFTAAMLMKRNDGHVESIRIAYGGVAPVVLRLTKTEEFLAGKTFEKSTFAAAGEIARAEVAPISDVRGTKDYRLQLAENVLTKFYYDTR